MNLVAVILTLFLVSLTDAANVVNYRYFKFEPTNYRGGPNFWRTQLSEIKIALNGVRVDYSNAVATNPGGSQSGGYGPEKAIDNNVGTKWFDDNKKPLIIDFNTHVSADTYTYVTGGDDTGRDPIGWKFWGSNDTTAAWTLLDSRDFAASAVTTARMVSLAWFTLDATSAPTAAPTNTPTAPTSNPTATSLPTEWLPTQARLLGATLEESLLFRMWEQVQALQHGASVQEALQFSKWEQVQALKFNASVQVALEFQKWEQTKALELGASAQEALQFTSWEQTRALGLGATPTEALQFITFEQTRALDRGATVAEALQAA